MADESVKKLLRLREAEETSAAEQGLLGLLGRESRRYIGGMSLEAALESLYAYERAAQELRVRLRRFHEQRS